MTSPADIRAKARRKLQLTRELGCPREERLHPSKGGVAGFLVRHQKEILDYHNELLAPASKATIYQWIREIHPRKMTGNNDKTELVGKDLSLLVLCIIVHPQALLDEMVMFIYNKGGGLHSRQLISHRLQDLDVTQKKLGIQAYKAYSPANMRREYLFWHHWLPLGVVDIPHKHFIDHLSKARWIGNYGKNQKLTVMLAVETGDPNIPNHLFGSIAWPQQWVWVQRVAGTTGDSSAAFGGTICSAVEDYGDEPRVFLWDNLTGPAQFDILPSPAYQPKYGSFEYVMCQLQQIIQAAAANGPFNNAFTHCGYSEDGAYPGVNLPDPPQALVGWELLGLPNADPQAPNWELLGLPHAKLCG
eukprot:jgi/Psemu1/8222/gm1.8222_g